MTLAVAVSWVAVCAYDDLLPERGVAALVNGRQVAVFRTHEGDVHAVANLDPFSNAHVLARGIVGSRGDVPVVVSPMYKHAFDLRSGRCLDDPEMALQVWPARVVGGTVEVAG